MAEFSHKCVGGCGRETVTNNLLPQELCPSCRELLELGRLVNSLEIGQELWHCQSDWAVAKEMSEGFDDYGEPATFLDVEGRGKTPLEALRNAKKGGSK